MKANYHFDVVWYGCGTGCGLNKTVCDTLMFMYTTILSQLQTPFEVISGIYGMHAHIHAWFMRQTTSTISTNRYKNSSEHANG